jgi:transposase
MRPYSRALRLRVVQAYENHEGSMRRLAARFRLSLRCVRDLLTRYHATGDAAPQPHGGGYPAQLDATGLEALRALVHATPAATLQELCPRLSTIAHITVSPAALSRALTTLGRPRKKHFSRRRARAAGGPTTKGRHARKRPAARP